MNKKCDCGRKEPALAGNGGMVYEAHFTLKRAGKRGLRFYGGLMNYDIFQQI